MELLLRNRLSTLVLALALATVAWAQTGTQTIDFAGSTFSPQVYEIQGRQVYRADDPQVLSLIGRANVTAQWSSSGQTLFVFAPGRESYWTVGSDKAKINGKEQDAPGLLLSEDGKQYIEPSALFYAITTRGVRDGSGYDLFPVLTEVAASDTGFLLRSASKAKATSQTDGDSTVLTLNGFSWDGAKELTLDKTLFEFSGGAEQGKPLQIRITPEPFTVARLAGSTLLNETRVNLLPNFPGAEQAREVTLKSLTSQQSEGMPMLVFEFDGGTRMHYVKDTQQKVLRVFIPHGVSLQETLQERDWPGVEISRFDTALYPVLEITIPLGENMEFIQLEDAPTTLALLRGSQLQELADAGSVETPGWVNIRGTIVIDPGHGGSDPGCRNPVLGTREADVTLAISLHLAEILRAQGWNVVLTRETDRDVTYAGSPDMMELQARADVANSIGADLFMSIHCNASVNTGATGTSIHWWKAEDYEFAQSLEHVLGTTIGLGQKGLIRDRFVVLRHAQMPSVLVETAFLSNYSEGSKLSDPAFQQLIARQLAGGLASYMQGRYASRGGGRAVE
jgi:N-acetylmuramoyl-L-alanine amidase